MKGVKKVRKIIVVEFMGLPRTGKTSHIEEIARGLRRRGYKVRCIQDQVKDAPFEDELERNRWSIRETGNLISEAKKQDWDLILVDRGGWAHYASIEALIRDGELIRTDEEIKKARSIQRIARDVVDDEDFYILIELPPRLCLKRDRRFGSQVGKIINLPLLSKMEEAYQELKVKISSQEILVINGEQDFAKNQQKILKVIFSLLPKGNFQDEVVGCKKIIN
jgi:thymidylate kinase